MNRPGDNEQSAPPDWRACGDRALAHVPVTGSQATALVVPEPGCREVTGRAGDATLTVVTRVESRY